MTKTVSSYFLKCNIKHLSNNSQHITAHSTTILHLYLQRKGNKNRTTACTRLCPEHFTYITSFTPQTHFRDKEIEALTDETTYPKLQNHCQTGTQAQEILLKSYMRAHTQTNTHTHSSKSDFLTFRLCSTFLFKIHFDKPRTKHWMYIGGHILKSKFTK